MEAKTETKTKAKVLTSEDVKQRDAKLTQLASARAVKAEKQTKAKTVKRHPVLRTAGKGVLAVLGIGVAATVSVFVVVLGAVTLKKVFGINTYRVIENRAEFLKAVEEK